MTDIESLIARLAEATAQLDSGELPEDARRELIDRLAEIAIELGAELDRRARATPAQRTSKPTPGE